MPGTDKQTGVLSPPKWQLSQKLLLAIGFLSFVPLLVIFVLISQLIRYQVETQAVNNLTRHASIESNRISAIFNEQVSTIRTVILTDPVIIDAIRHSNSNYGSNQAQIYQRLTSLDNIWQNDTDIGNELVARITQNDIAIRLRTLQNQMDGHAEIFITDRYGAIVGASRPTSDYYQADEAWWQESWNNGDGAIYFSSPLFDESSNTTAIIIVIPIIDNGEVIGIVKTVYDISIVIDDIEQFELNDTGTAHLINTDGCFIVSDGLGDISEAVPSEILQDGQIFSGSGSELSLKFLDSNQINRHLSIGYAPLQNIDDSSPNNGPGWVVLITQDYDEVYAPIKQMRRIITIAMLIAGASSIGLAMIIGHNLTSGLRHLAKIATQLGAGQLNVRAQVDTEDEIGNLAQIFNRMAESIQHRDASLSDLNKSLEHRVRERTRDLEIASVVSRQVTTVLDVNTLLPHLTELTNDGFGLHHTAVFLYNERTQTLKIAAGVGAVGKKLKEQEHEFELDSRQSLVARAARLREPVIVSDVTQSKEHFKNPLLSQTRSEVSLPMLVGDMLIGVLNLQSTKVNHFTEKHIEVLKILAEQIGIAVQNANLYQQATDARLEAEQANQVKSQFLAAMSHELRTPLNGIMNFTGVVADGMVGEVNERQAKLLNDAISNADHLLNLINDVLDISKIESGALSLFIESDINIADISQEVLTTGKSLLGDKPVDIILEIEDNLPLIMGDARRIRQILLNIISNACKFTEQGTITVAINQQNDSIKLSVCDTGPGIAPEDYDAVFETFQQTETGIKSGKGTGLGMPICKRLVEAHHGKMWLESEPGKGTTFFVTLPFQNMPIIQQGS